MLTKYCWRFFCLSLLITSPIYHLYPFPILFKKPIETLFLSLYSPSQLEFLYNSLFIFYAFPNIFLLIFKGQFLKILTLRRIIFMSSTMVYLSWVCMEIGITYGSFYLMIFSRGLYGFGSESLFSVINLLLLKYFHKENLAYLEAFLITLGNIILVISFQISGFLYFESIDLTSVMRFNGVLALISYISSIFTVIYDYYLEKNTRQINILLENFKKRNKQDKIQLMDLYVNSHFNAIPQKINYFLYIFVFFYIPGILCFFNFGSSFLYEKYYYEMGIKQGIFMISIGFSMFSLISTVSASLMTFYLQTSDGNNEEFLIFLSFLSLLSHLSLLFYDPYVGLICLGISYGSSYSLIMSLIEKNHQNQDFIHCAINLGVIILSYFLAFISQSGPFYSKNEILLLFCSIISFIVAVNYFHDGKLKMQGNPNSNATIKEIREGDMVESEIKTTNTFGASGLER